MSGSEADYSPPSSAEVKNAWSYTFTPQYVFMAWCLVKHKDNFTLLLQTSRRNIRRKTNPENEGAREWVPLLLSNDQETTYRGRFEHDGRSGVVYHMTGKLFPYWQDTKQCSPSQIKDR
jgi:hypothetical protein